MKIKVTHLVRLTATALGESEFGTEFQKKLSEQVLKLVPDGGVVMDVPGRKACEYWFYVPLDKAQDLKNRFKNTVVMLIEHGPNSDVLESVLSKYPQLRNHPRLHDVVSAFENLNGVIENVLGDKSNRVLAEISRQTAEVIVEPDEPFIQAQATQRTKETMDAASRASFRDKARLGQTDEQRSVPPTAGAKPEIPDIYKKVGKKPPNEEAIGDHGNVFGSA